MKIIGRFGYCVLMVLALGLSGYQLPDSDKLHPSTSTLDEISQSLSAMVRDAEQGLVYIESERHSSSPSSEEKRVARGSGFLVDLEQGYIITNSHVIRKSEKITVTLANDEQYDASIVGHSKEIDIAVIKIEQQDFNRQGLRSLTLADSDEVQIGELVVALGAPLGLKSSVSLGIVSGLERKDVTKLGSFIQTDAAINPGNSGGPLLNSVGEVVGVNTIKIVHYTVDGIGFAVPSNIARRVGERLIDSGKFESGYIGVNLENKFNDDARSFYPALEDGEGAVLVASVDAGSPAEQSGIRASDLIVEVDGEKVSTGGEFRYQVGFSPPGAIIELVIVRHGEQQRQTTTVKLEDDPKEQQRPQVDVWNLKFEQTEEGVKVVERRRSDYALLIGDIILAVDDNEDPELEWLAKYLSERDKVQLQIKRRNKFKVVVLHKN